jgi:hypothetical protein
MIRRAAVPMHRVPLPLALADGWAVAWLGWAGLGLAWLIAVALNSRTFLMAPPVYYTQLRLAGAGDWSSWARLRPGHR